jgi:hypothetical protein
MLLRRGESRLSGAPGRRHSVKLYVAAGDTIVDTAGELTSYVLNTLRWMTIWGCKPKPQKIPRPLDHAYSPSPDDPSVPRVGWRPITVLTATPIV